MKYLTQEQTDALLRDDMEYKFKPWQPVIVRDFEDEKWRATFFSHYGEHDEYKHHCVNDDAYKYCLPAKGNRHLIGTTDSPTPPEPEFKFGDKVEAMDYRKVWQRCIFIQKETGAEGWAYKVRFENDSFGLFTKDNIRHADW